MLIKDSFSLVSTLAKPQDGSENIRKQKDHTKEHDVVSRKGHNACFWVN